MATSPLETEKEVDPPDTNTDTDTNGIVATPSKTTKKRGPFGIFFTSLLGRNRPIERKARLPAQCNLQRPPGRPWKNIICGLRPLHQLDQQNSQTPRATRSRRTDAFDDLSLAPSSSGSSASESLNSRYASAVDLQALDGGHDENNDNNKEEKLTLGPNSIDIKAEAFIARFYEQMNLQEIESTDGRREC